MILSTNTTIESLSKALISHKRVYFTRFGDGDIVLISGGDTIASGNRQEFSIEIQEELHDALKISDPLYMKALALEWEIEPGMTMGLFAPNYIKENIKNKINQISNNIYFNPVVFHYLAVFQPNILKKFLAQHIIPKRKMFIGSASKKNMEKFFGKIDIYIQTPEKNSYNSINKWYNKITENLKNIELILPCTGFASRVITKRLWYQNVNAHVIDIGSVVDPIDNKFMTRTCWKLKGMEVRKEFIKK